MYHHHSYDGDAAIIKLSRHKERGGAEADDQNLIGNSLVICKSPDCVVWRHENKHGVSCEWPGSWSRSSHAPPRPSVQTRPGSVSHLNIVTSTPYMYNWSNVYTGQPHHSVIRGTLICLNCLYLLSTLLATTWWKWKQTNILTAPNTIIGTEHPPCPPADLVTVEKANNSRQFIRSLAQLVKMADASCLPGILIVKSIGITHSTQQPHSQKYKRLIG